MAQVCEITVRLPASNIAKKIKLPDTSTISFLLEYMISGVSVFYFVQQKYHFLSIMDNGPQLNGNFALKQVAGKVSI